MANPLTDYCFWIGILIILNFELLYQFIRKQGVNK